MSPSSRAASPSAATQSASETRPHMSHPTERADEETPLLVRHDDDNEGTTEQAHASAVSSLLASIKSLGQRKPGAPRRWPSILALFILCLVVVIILVAGFFAPEVVKDYAQQAAVFEPTSLSIDSFTPTGIVARVQGDFVLDASRVHKQSTRNFGRLATWMTRAMQIDASDVSIALPQYDDLLLGTAHVPPVVVSIVNGQHNDIDILAELTPGPVDGIRRIANDFIEGRLGDVLVAANANVALRSGIFSFGSTALTHFLSLKGSDVPTLPKYSVQKLNIHEINVPAGARGLAVDIAVAIENKYPVDIVIPPLGFSILANGCSSSDPYIMLADSTTAEVTVRPKHDIPVNATAFLKQLPDEFLSACPDTQKSPLDMLVGHYMKGKPATFYVQGSDSPDVKTPKWISELSSGIVVPVSMPGTGPDDLMKNFSMTNVKFSLPDFWAEPGSPAASPKISADIRALIGLPEQINFDVGVNKFMANATIFYKGNELGRLDLTRWQKATSRPVAAPHKSHSDLEVSTHVEQAPLNITNDEVFQDVLSALLMGSSSIHMAVKAKAAVGMQTPLGDFVIKDIPAEGDVPVNPIGGGGGGGGLPDFDKLALRVGDVKIVDTTASSLTISAAVNFSNPTSYSAIVPYADVHIVVNDTILGHGTVRNLAMVPGNNTNVQLSAVWSPGAVDGHKGAAVGRELLSQFISGYNSTLTIVTHAGTIPAQPALGRALEKFTITIPTWKLLTPSQPGDGDGNGDDDAEPSRPHFITDTVMHILTSTATFTLHSPFAYTSLWIADLKATAYYKGDVVGKILNTGSIEVPPGISETPRLPVDWSLNSVGYEALKSALGGRLFLSADATTSVRIGKYEERVWFRGKGIGAKIRI